MQKYRNAQVKTFEFNDLQSSHVVSNEATPKAFDFQALHGESLNRPKMSEETIRSERAFESKSSFRIDDNVRESRGISRQEKGDFEGRIEQEVERRLEEAYKQAYAEGIEKGRAEGKEEAMNDYHEALGQKVEDFAQVIAQVQQQSTRIGETSKAEIYEFVKRFTKWIVLKEINEKVYLEALLEKLLLELNVRKNLIIKVGRAQFSDMPEVVKAVEARLGQLSNTRIEIVPELSHPGIILESENGLIDGSMEGVFKNIDKIFEQVLGHE
jgi:flagellar assembly protein FliH